MTEVADDDPVEANADGVTLLYDFFKHLTSLCVLSLGGVLALIPNAKGAKPELIVTVLVVIGAAAVLSFSGASEIVRSRLLGKPAHRTLHFCRIAAPALLSVGLGMFVYLFMWTLK